MSKKNFYIPGRPTYIYHNNVCYRKTGERTYDTGTIWKEEDVDRTSTTKDDFIDTGKAIWIQNSCEECSTPGGIQMISVDWVAASIAINPDGQPLSNPSLGSDFFHIMPLRQQDFIPGQDDHDGDGDDDSLIGPGLVASITIGEIDSFADVYGAITPIKLGVSPPEAGRVDPLSAVDGFYRIESDTSFSVYMEVDPEDVEILPGHPEYDYDNNDLDLYSVRPAIDGGGVKMTVDILNAFDQMIPGQEYNPSPTAPSIHEVFDEPAFYAIRPHGSDLNGSIQTGVTLVNNTFIQVSGVGSWAEEERREGTTTVDSGRVGLYDVWKKLKSGGDANNPADWEGEEGQYTSSTTGARLFQFMAIPAAPDGNWDNLPTGNP